MAIPWFPKSQSSLLVELSGIYQEISGIWDQKLNLKKNCNLGLGTSIAAVDNSGLLGRQLEWGCSVFFQNELYIFGVHVNAPNYSDVSYKAGQPFH